MATGSRSRPTSGRRAVVRGPGPGRRRAQPRAGLRGPTVQGPGSRPTVRAVEGRGPGPPSSSAGGGLKIGRRAHSAAAAEGRAHGPRPSFGRSSRAQGRAAGLMARPRRGPRAGAAVQLRPPRAGAHGSRPTSGRRAEPRAGLRGLKAGRPGPDGPAVAGRGSGRSWTAAGSRSGRPGPGLTAHGPARAGLGGLNLGPGSAGSTSGRNRPCRAVFGPPTCGPKANVDVRTSGSPRADPARRAAGRPDGPRPTAPARLGAAQGRRGAWT